MLLSLAGDGDDDLFMSTGVHQGSHGSARSNPATHIAIAILLVVGAMTTTAFLAKYEMVPWTSLIFVSGTVGGVVNNFRRIQKLPAKRRRVSGAISDRLVTIQIYVSPFVGGVFAIVLYGVFMSGLVQGSLFPEFKSGGEDFTTFKDFASQSMPSTNTDMAKAILWAFIAGFSEGLVPNFISKITKDAGQEDDSKAPPTKEDEPG